MSDVDWDRHLAAVSGDDHEAAMDAVEHLMTAGLHQSAGRSEAVRTVARLIDESAVDPGIRDGLLTWLGYSAEAGLDDNALLETYPTVWAFVEVENPDLRRTAIRAAVEFARSPVLETQRPELVALLRRRVADEHRAWYVRHLARLGDDVTDFLDDSDVDARTVAALATDGDDATAIIVNALRRATGNDGWRGYSLTDLVSATLARVPDFDRIAEAAAEIVRTASWTGYDRTWGPLVRKAFAAPGRLTWSQRLVLGGLVDNDQLWYPGNGGVALVFKDAGLPHDREQCRRLLAT